jgi:hypothetical protein
MELGMQVSAMEVECKALLVLTVGKQSKENAILMHDNELKIR